MLRSSNAASLPGWRQTWPMLLPHISSLVSSDHKTFFQNLNDLPLWVLAKRILAFLWWGFRNGVFLGLRPLKLASFRRRPIVRRLIEISSYFSRSCWIFLEWKMWSLEMGLVEIYVYNLSSNLENPIIYPHQKFFPIFFSDSFSKCVAFTKFLSKERESKFL